MNSLGGLEQAVMEQLWTAGGPQSVREVHGRLDRDLAYTTVMTVLARLAKKGVVRRERDGRAFRYEPVQAREDMVADVMLTALEGDTTPDRSAALVAFAGRLSPADAEVLRQALDRLEASRPD